jgi:hypothetical protein
MDTVLAELPTRGRLKLGRSPAELCAQIERSIAEYGSEQGSPTPEEGLALLAASAPAEPEPAAPTEPLLASPESGLELRETAATGSARKKWILAAVAGLMIVIALLFWEMR